MISVSIVNARDYILHVARTRNDVGRVVIYDGQVCG
jgi:hypothetical protein